MSGYVVLERKRDGAGILVTDKLKNSYFENK